MTYDEKPAGRIIRSKEELADWMVQADVACAKLGLNKAVEEQPAAFPYWIRGIVMCETMYIIFFTKAQAEQLVKV